MIKKSNTNTIFIRKIGKNPKFIEIFNKSGISDALKIYTHLVYS